MTRWKILYAFKFVFFFPILFVRSFSFAASSPQYYKILNWKLFRQSLPVRTCFADCFSFEWYLCVRVQHSFVRSFIHSLTRLSDLQIFSLIDLVSNENAHVYCLRTHTPHFWLNNNKMKQRTMCEQITQNYFELEVVAIILTTAIDDGQRRQERASKTIKFDFLIVWSERKR